MRKLTCVLVLFNSKMLILKVITPLHETRVWPHETSYPLDRVLITVCSCKTPRKTKTYSCMELFTVSGMLAI